MFKDQVVWLSGLRLTNWEQKGEKKVKTNIFSPAAHIKIKGGK